MLSPPPALGPRTGQTPRARGWAPRVLLAGLVVALASAGWWFALRRQAAAMQRWPSVMGEVVASELVTRDGATTGRAVIVVRYQVAGETFEVSGRDGLPVRGSVMPSELVRRFPVGAALEVAYDPEAPQRASLSRSRDTTVAVFGVGVGLVLVTLAVAVRRRRTPR